MGKRIITTEATEEDARIEGSLRPTRLADYTGQKRLVDNLKIYIDAVKFRRESSPNESLDHMLLYGPPGLGKTTRPSRSRERSRPSSTGCRREMSSLSMRFTG